MRKPLVAFLLLFFPYFSWAIEFQYKYNQGDQFRFLSRVYQQHGFTDETLQESQLVNRMTFKIETVEGERGRLVGGHQTSQKVNRSENSASVWDKEYPIDFWRDRQGVYQVAATQFVPMVRNVPYFPTGRDFRIGEKWFGRGEEVHDMSKQIGYPQPFRIPIVVEYEYVGPTQQKGKKYQLIRAKYKYNQAIPEAYVTNVSRRNNPYPNKLRGQFEQDIYWDEEISQPGFYKEKYEMSLEFTNKRTYLFKGEAEAYLIEVKPMDKEQLIDDLKQKLAQSGFSNVQVKKGEKGVTFSLDNILFVADSAQILPGQDEKLQFLGKILSGYQERDIALVGHTAQIGSDPGEGQVLSEMRAKAIADYLVRSGHKKMDNIIVEGKGGREPLSENKTEAGRTKNRRVEVTILEN
ncbi:MAG: OmpA family protein [Spirochaetia bacterium]